MGKVNSEIQGRAIAPIVDVGCLLVAAAGLPTAVSFFTQHRSETATFLVIGFIFFCLSVYWLKRLEPATVPEKAPAWLDWLLQPRILRLLGAAFALFFTTLVALELGYFDAIFQVDVRELGSGESASLLTYAPGAWLAGFLIYLLILGSAAPPTILHTNGRYLLWQTLGLVGVNGMVLLVTAVLATYNLSWAWALPLLLLFMLMFAPPRLVYWQKRPSTLSLLTFAAFLIAATARLFI